MRQSNRINNQLRKIQLIRNYLPAAEGSVLISFGDTKVICTASFSEGAPPFLKGSGTGWVTAEYGMLPRSTLSRMGREATRGKQSGRTQEIQRLIGRALRAAIDLSALGENTLIIDCDVIQADGGTRTAAITGGCVALYEALNNLTAQKRIPTNPFKSFVAAVSVGIIAGVPMLDLDYNEDVVADTDMNIVMNDEQGFIEVQGTAERQSFSQTELDELLTLAKGGINELIQLQKS